MIVTTRATRVIPSLLSFPVMSEAFLTTAFFL